MKLLLWLAELFLKLWNIATAEGTVSEASGFVLTDGRTIPESSKAVPIARKAVPNTHICTSIKNVPYFKKYETQKMQKKMCNALQKCAIFFTKRSYTSTKMHGNSTEMRNTYTKMSDTSTHNVV